MNGLCIEVTTVGCGCRPVSSYAPAECGEDVFSDLTSGGTVPFVEKGIAGVCPQCGGAVTYTQVMIPTPPTAETTAALLAAIVAADEGFAEAAEAVNRGIIDQTTYQRAADSLYRAIDAAREYLGGA